MLWGGGMRIRVSNKNPVTIKPGLSQAALYILYRMGNRRDINFYFESKEIVEEPDEVISDENKPRPAVYINSRPEREEINVIRIPDLNSCDNQYDKADGVYPVPDPDRYWMKIYPFHSLPPFRNLRIYLTGEVSILNVM